MDWTEGDLDYMIQYLKETRDTFENKKYTDDLIKEIELGKHLHRLYMKLVGTTLFTQVIITDEELAAIDYFSALRVHDLNNKENLDDRERSILNQLIAIRGKMMAHISVSETIRVALNRPDIKFSLPSFEIKFLQIEISKYMTDEIVRLIDEISKTIGGGLRE